MLPSLHISLLCHNRLDLTKACLASLALTRTAYSLTITNNASTDGTRKWLDHYAATRPRVYIVHNRENLGYKDPHNLVWKRQHKRCDYFTILNNDVVLGPRWFAKALAAFKHDPSLAIVGSNQGVCSCLNPDFGGRPAALNEPPEYVEGSLLILRTSLISPLAPTLFSPALQFMYGEDSDLSLRTRERGLHIATFDLGCSHQGSATVHTIDATTKARIASALEANLTYLRQRWASYLLHRDLGLH